jgi:hypothetical protein
MACAWLRWPSAGLQTWDREEQRVALGALENELPAVPAAEVRLQGWFELPWPDEAALLRVRADRWPTVDLHAAGVSDGRPVAAGYLESWRVPGEVDGYAPAALAAWVWNIWELDGLAALRAASHRVVLSSEVTRYATSSRVGQG